VDFAAEGAVGTTGCAAAGTLSSAVAASDFGRDIRVAFTCAVCSISVRRVDAGTERAVEFVDCVAPDEVVAVAAAREFAGVDADAAGALETVDCVALGGDSGKRDVESGGNAGPCA
jgi:hypothetical protein